MFKKKADFGFIVGVKEEYNALKNTKYDVKIAYGAKNASKAAKILCKKVECIVSFGFAGSIDSKLTNGEIIIPKFLIGKNKKKKFLSSKYRSTILHKLSNQKVNEKGIISVEKIINENESKKRIYEKFKASSIDMESDSIYKICYEKKIPLIIVRVIFDDLSFNIPNFIIKSTNSNGDISITSLLKFVFTSPKNLFILARIYIYYLRAIRKLKEISEKCF